MGPEGNIWLLTEADGYRQPAWLVVMQRPNVPLVTLGGYRTQEAAAKHCATWARWNPESVVSVRWGNLPGPVGDIMFL